METACPVECDKIVRLPADLHRYAKAEASLDGVDLKVWLSRLVVAELARRGKEPACVRK